MKKYQDLEDLPLALTARDIASVLGLSVAGAYNLLHDKNFPTLEVGTRLIVMKPSFLAWLEKNIGGQNQVKGYEQKE